VHLDELRTFLEIIDAGSLVGASRRLHVTPSTVTARLASLEASVGQRLLHRSKSGVELSAAGFTLQRYAELMVQLSRLAKDELAQPNDAAGVCTVGLAFDLWSGFGEAFLDAMRSHASDISVALWPGDHGELARWLDTGLIDLAFDYRPQAREGIVSQTLFDDELVLVSADLSAPMGFDPSPSGRYVYVDHGEEFRRRHAEAFVNAPSARLTIAQSDWALAYLLRHGAKGYLPRRVAAGALASGQLHELPGAPILRRRIHVIANPKATDRWTWYPRVLSDTVSRAASIPGPAPVTPP
jgi:DNA-binding transcriptional LysR family regulator